jgi:glycosyltransferase involved in cell wall biosynthesis
MPPLEAMACGIPVICANNSSLPEVVGNIAKMVPSDDTDALLDEMKNYLSNIDELTKKSVIEGPKQAERFSWTKSAKIILDAIKDAS